MLKLLSSLSTYFKRQEIVTDNAIFRIHSSFTTVFLLTFSLIITWTHFVKMAIRCQVSGVSQHVVNTYCWVMTTFLMPDAFQRQTGYAHPGLGNDYDDVTGHKYYAYYQWTCFVLFFQALLFYFPKWLWDNWENGLMTAIVCELNTGLRTEQEKYEKQGILISYLVKHRNQHNTYTFQYWFCELLCLLNVILQMVLMNRFFNGDFLLYGLKVLTFDDEDQEDRYDHMIYVFPRVTKCIFRKFGPSGTLEKHDAICLLPLNIVNEKTYIFLWFWLIILAVLTASLVIFRVLLICIPRLRSFLLCTQNRMVPVEAADAVSRRASVGDWWVLYMLGRNLDPQVYKEVIEELAKKDVVLKTVE